MNLFWMVKSKIERLFLKAVYRRALVISTHLVLIALANYSAFLIRFDWAIPPLETGLFWKTLPMVVLVQFSCISFFGLNKGLWRYAGILDLWNIIKAVSLSSALLVLILYFGLGVHKYPRSIYVIDWMILTIFLGGVRMQWRLFREFRSLSEPGKIRVLLIGAGDAGNLFLREIKQNPELAYWPVGFIDDDPRKRGLKVQGVPVLGCREDLVEISERNHIEEIIITISSASAGQMQDIVSDCQKTGLKLKIVPGIGRLVHGQIPISKIRDVRIEDLLYREVVRTDTTQIGTYLKGRPVLVTGAAGSIGSELCRQISLYGPANLLLLDQSESSLYFTEIELAEAHPSIEIIPIVGDIRDGRRMEAVVKQWRPEVIFHSAAYKHVPLLEQNPCEAVKNNVMATRDLARMALENGIEKFVLISTDKAVNPTSVMGATKRVAELYIQSLTDQGPTHFMIVRFGNVLGSNGSVIPLFRKQIEKKKPVTVTHPDITRYFMTIPEAVQLVLQATIMGKGGEIFVLDMGAQVKILDLARHMITLSGYVPDQDIPIVFTGLRPGEKLYEELFDRGEKVEGTEHEKIKKAVGSEPLEVKDLSRQIGELERLAVEGDERGVIEKLKEVVPGFGEPVSPLGGSG